MAKKRSTIAILGVVVLLLASTAFYIAVRPFDSMPDGPSALNEPNAALRRPSGHRAAQP